MSGRRSVAAPRSSGGETKQCSSHPTATIRFRTSKSSSSGRSIDPDGDFRAGREILANAHDFKTPCNMAIADSMPERKFIRLMCERQNALALDAWLKSAPQRYYAIDYAWKKGEHPKRGEFTTLGSTFPCPSSPDRDR